MALPAGSITRLIPGVQRGDEYAIEALWHRYVSRVQGIARPLMVGLPPGAGDEEDVAQSAFRAFFDAAADGRAYKINGRDELWRLLATISRRKAVDRVRRELRNRRGGGVAHSPNELGKLPNGDATPSTMMELQEDLAILLSQLDATGDPKLREIAIRRLEGASNEEIAHQLECTVRSVQRKLQILEKLWTERDE